MKRSLLVALSIWFTAALSAGAGDGVIDLTTLANYANQPVPAYITKSNNPASNAITDRGATLGRVLFYDKRLSRDNSIACSSCHRQSRAFGDIATASTGVAGTTGRHGMRLGNARFANEVRFFWDERATSLENQASQPIRNHVEMGFSGGAGDPTIADLIGKLSAISDYRVLFTMAFGDAAITEARVQLALAQFIRSIQSFDSKFDLGRAQVGNNNASFPNFSPSENNGKSLFINPPPGGAGCASCHRPPEFDIDPASRNNGVITQIGGGVDLTNTRSPSLRDVIGPGGLSNGALMHDGSKATLASVIDHYDRIPGDNPNLDPRLRRPGGTQLLNLSQQERNDLIAFLRTLTGSAIYSDPRWSDPFDGQGKLSLIVLPATPLTITRQGNGSTALVSSKAAPRLSYLLQSSLDLQAWTNIATVNSGASGACSQLVTVTGSAFFRYAFQPPPVPTGSSQLFKVTGRRRK